MTEREASLPETGRLIGIDFGTKRVGVAVSTGDRTIASPVEVYQRRNELLDARYFKQLLPEYRPVGVVVGLPMHIAGNEGIKAHEARDFGSWLGKQLALPIAYWDERYTSVVAEEHLLAAHLTRKKRKARLDALAAQLILQSYLDYHRPRDEPARPSEDEFDLDTTGCDQEELS